MKQNVYDDPGFFAGYMSLRSGERGLNAAIEEPAVRSLLPALDGLRVIDLGCGFGKFADYCLQRHIADFIGFDLSQNMIAEAKRRVHDARASFRVGAIEDFEAGQESTDLVVSSLCLHYVNDVAPVFSRIAAALKPGGHLIFSVEHPICTSLLKGWYESEGKALHWPVDHYSSEGVRHARWLVDDVVKYHRTVETVIPPFLAIVKNGAMRQAPTSAWA